MTIPHLDAFRATVLAVQREDNAPTCKHEPERSARQDVEVRAAGWVRVGLWYAHPRRHLGPLSLTTARACARVRGDGRWPASRVPNGDMLDAISACFNTY